jgi:hypothetical protein
MPDTQTLETTAAATEREGDVHLTSPSRRAAAVEAAYILEAIRK